MNAAQIAHFLKNVGKGSEWLGITNVYRAGWFVGAGQAVTVIGGDYIVYRIGKWGYKKLEECLREKSYLAEGQVV